MADAPSKALLIILDGYGIASDPTVSAIDRADKPFIDHLFDTYPHATLSASGEDVGLPAGQFGNSEVGHLNIGAGRVVLQKLSEINQSIESGDFFEKNALLEAIHEAKPTGRIHFMGLFSDGGVHSAISHLYALLELAKSHGIDHAFVHAFTDGRDTDPKSGIEFVEQFQEKTAEIGAGTLASIVGRYYAMDRDNRWQRTQKAYDLLVNAKGKTFDEPREALQDSYNDDITDEFVEPRRIETKADSRIQPGDVVVFFNIRGDRARQITRAFTEPGFDEFEVNDDLNPAYFTFTEYDDNFDNVMVVFPSKDIKNTLGEIVSKHRLKQLRIAETEKYPHVTYFFNGGREASFEGEERILIPSPKVATYDMQPEMSAPAVANALRDQLLTEKHHLGILNFANPDMVGHTGDMNATIEAIETVDRQLKKIIPAAREHDYRTLIIADHGNADKLINDDGSPHTSHTTALVPVLLISDENRTLHSGILADVAPTLLELMGVNQPEEMTGQSLLE